MGWEEASAMPTKLLSKLGQPSGAPSSEVDPSCLRSAAPIVPPPVKNLNAIEGSMLIDLKNELVN